MPNFDENYSIFAKFAKDPDGFVILKSRGNEPKYTGKVLILALEDSDDTITYNSTELSNQLDQLEEFVRGGKYDKALAVRHESLLEDFFDIFNKVDLDSRAGRKLLTLMRRFLSIGKSFYEYDPKQQEIVDNITYDGLMARYLKMGEIEPTGIIPKGLKTLQKTSIKYPMLHNNMDKAYTIGVDEPVPEGVKEADSIEAFLMRAYRTLDMTPSQELTLELSPKLDGVSLNGTVDEDKLMSPQTRGDQEESVAVIGMNGYQFKHKDDHPYMFGIQFEAFCTDENRIKASEYLGLERPYVSCRHAAAGIIHRLSTELDENLIKFISLYPITTEGLEGSYLERMEYIQKFTNLPRDMISRVQVTGDMKTLLVKIRETMERFGKQRENLSYAIDGMVITVVNDECQETLGREGRTNKFQIALKFDPATAIATVSGITLDNGRKGFRTIQVNLEHPVFLDGVRYDHIPVLSLNLFQSLDLCYGSTVRVHRVGDVIPAISVLEKGNGKPISYPTICPSCGKELRVHNKKLYCDNPECPSNIVGIFTYFFDAMGLVGYSDSFATMLVEKMNCKNLGNVLKLTDDDFNSKGCNSVLTVGFVDRLKGAIQNHTDYEVLGAMGLPGVGPAKAKILLQNIDLFKYINPMGFHNPFDYSLINACKAAVGDRQAEDLQRYLRSIGFVCSWLAVSNIITKITKDFTPKVKVGHTGGRLSAEVIRICELNGFEVTDSKSFDILITPSLDRESTKMTAAKKKNAPIFLEDDFIAQYGKADENVS